MLSLEIMADCLSMSAALKLTSWLKFPEIQFTEVHTVFKGVLTFYQYFSHILFSVGAMWYTISRLMPLSNCEFRDSRFIKSHRILN